MFSTKSTATTRKGMSTMSIESIGIGSGSSGGGNQKQLDAEYIKLRPVGNNLPANSVIFDCVVYMIYCCEHNRYAVTDSSPIWFPFVAKDGRNWNRAIDEGLLTLFEDTNCDSEVIVKPKLNFKLNSRCLELFRVQNVNGSWALRNTQFVTIIECKNNCKPINNIQWMDGSYIIDNSEDIFWGPEFRIHYDSLQTKGKIFGDNINFSVNEQPFEQIQQILIDNERSNSDELLSAKITKEVLYHLYEQYLNHTFPSYYMNYTSFKVFLQKCGFPINYKEDANCPIARSYFKCCLDRPKRSNNENYIDFRDICYLLMATDPNTPNENCRIRFVFNYYASNNDHSLSLEQLHEMLQDIKSQQNKLSILERNTFIEPTFGRLTFSEFIKEVHSGRIFGTELLCRSTQSMADKLANNLARSGVASKVQRFRKTNKQNGGVYCRNCQFKTLNYSQHCVTINSMGRCAEPKLIQNFETCLNIKPTGRSKYSQENVFRTNSIGNVFFDYVRDKRFLNNNGQSEPKEFYEYFKILCDRIALLVKQESKLIKRNCPALVIGNIQGNLDILLTMQNHFWPTMPVLTQNLIFLGNYSGQINNCMIEVIIYLFSIKYINPNKVILLRGIQETRAYNEKTLLVECNDRYGDTFGKLIWECINRVFDYLPYIAILNESIVCTSSGIPKDSNKNKLESLFQNYSHIKDCQVYQQIMINTPDFMSESEMSMRMSDKDNLFKQIPQIPNAYLFTRDAFRQFMKINQFSYMIRSTDIDYLGNGYRLYFNQKCITIFSNSSTKASDGKSKSAIALCSHTDSQIQLIEFE